MVCVYVGGHTPYPTYERVSDYTEGVTVLFDPKITSYSECLDHFFDAHTPFRYQPRKHSMWTELGVRVQSLEAGRAVRMWSVVA